MLEPGDTSTYNSKNKKSSFTDYQQREYDFDELEKRLLGTNLVDQTDEKETFDTQAFLKNLRK